MARVDDPTIRNPFGWRLADLNDPATDPDRRRRLRQELLVCEAEELAHGYRHLTIVHGDPTTLDATRHLSRFYDTISRLAADCAEIRVRGDADYVTITVRGPRPDEQLTMFAAAAHDANPGGWSILDTAVAPRHD